MLTNVGRAQAKQACIERPQAEQSVVCGPDALLKLVHPASKESLDSQAHHLCPPPCPHTHLTHKLNTQVLVAGESGAAVADGVSVGEVLIRGPTTFGGYWRNPAATAAAFTADGWFRTGDLATQRPDGYICVVDRKKDMILCGGENVYCSEVEAVLIAHPAVAQVAVFGVPNAVLGELVAAAVVLVAAPVSESASASATGVQQQLVEWCRSRLAHYKVPSQVHVVEAMPVTGSGKILKTELRQRVQVAAAWAPSRPAAALAAPAGPLPPGAALRTGPAQPLQLQQMTPTAAAGATGSASSLQELAARIAAAVAPSGAAVLSLTDSSLTLTANTTYVLLLSQDSSSTVQQQVQAALSKGARHLLLLCIEHQPTAEDTAGLEAVLSAHSAQAAVVLVDTAVLDDPQLLAYSVFDAAQGMPTPLAVLVSPEQQPQQLAVPGVSALQLSGLAAAALGAPTIPVGAAATLSALSSSTTYILAAASSADALQQQVQAAVSRGARHLLVLAGGEPTPAAARSLESVLHAAGAAATVALLDKAAVSNSSVLAYALYDAAADMPPVAAVLLPDVDMSAAAAGVAAETAQQIDVASAASASSPATEVAMIELIKAAVADLLGADTAQTISLDDPLMSAGVNSTTAVALTTQLEASLGTSLPPTLVFDYVTMRDMSTYLASIAGQGVQHTAPSVAAASPAAPSAALSAGAAPEVAGAAAAAASAVQLVSQAVLELLGSDAAVDPSAPLMSVGLNSTMAVALASLLEAAVGNPVPPTLVSCSQLLMHAWFAVCCNCSTVGHVK